MTDKKGADFAPHGDACAAESLGHVVPARTLVAVFAALLVLTAITVAVSYCDFGRLNLWVAIGVATAKASLVALYFMHLRYDHPLNAFVFVAAVVFLGLLISITLMDTLQYEPDLLNWP